MTDTPSTPRLTWSSTIVSCLVSLTTPLLCHAGQAPLFTLSRVQKGTEIAISPPKGHHINLKAPTSMTCRNAPLQLKAKAEGETTYSLPPNLGKGTLHCKAKAFICDDANTFCEQQSVEAVLR